MNTVRQHREALEMDRETLAVRSGISYAYISQIEARAGRDDEPTPGLDKARALAMVLGVDVDVLFPPKAEGATPEPTPAAEER